MRRWSTPATGGDGVTLSGLTQDPAGRDTGSTFTVPSGGTVTDALTLSQAGRVTASTAAVNGAVFANWSYVFDAADRLTQAGLAATAVHPKLVLGYGFAGSGGCGADTTAGLDSARATATSRVGGVTTNTRLCTDDASRLTSATGDSPLAAAAVTYDAHGNATRIGTQRWTYDGTDRVTTTTATVATPASTQKLTYTRDATDRVTQQTGSGTGAGVDLSTIRYGFVDGSDSPEFALTAAGALGERYLTLPGGVLVTRRYATTGGDTWSLPNIHGDVVATTDPAGALTGSGIIYDPFGQPINPSTCQVNTAATPTTRTGPTTDAWEGSHQRGYQHAMGLNQTLMGARVYLPALGVFTATDPIPGASANSYVYPADPVNMNDLTGMKPAGAGRRPQSKPKTLSESEKRALAHPNDADKKTLNSARAKQRFNEKLAGDRNRQKRGTQNNFSINKKYIIIGAAVILGGALILSGGSIFAIGGFAFG